MARPTARWSGATFRSAPGWMKGVAAIVQEVCTCRELFEALVGECYKSGMKAAVQYLDYLAIPYPEGPDLEPRSGPQGLSLRA